VTPPRTTKGTVLLAGNSQGDGSLGFSAKGKPKKPEAIGTGSHSDGSLGLLVK